MDILSLDLQSGLDQGLASNNASTKAEATNLVLEQGVSDIRRNFFETEDFSEHGKTWTMLSKRHADYVRLYIKTSQEPHTFDDTMYPNSIGKIDTVQNIVRLESLLRPLESYGCSYDELKTAHDSDDIDLLDDFLSLWNEDRDMRPAFATFLNAVSEDVCHDDWPDRLRDRLGLAHYSVANGPEPVALMRYSVSEVQAEATSGNPLTMPTVLDSDPWPHYFPAPRSLQYGRAMALTPCEGDETLVVEFLNAKVTYRRENLWKIGQIVTPAPIHEITDLRALHLLALQIASGDDKFGT